MRRQNSAPAVSSRPRVKGFGARLIRSRAGQLCTAQPTPRCEPPGRSGGRHGRSHPARIPAGRRCTAAACSEAQRAGSHARHVSRTVPPASGLCALCSRECRRSPPGRRGRPAERRCDRQSTSHWGLACCSLRRDARAGGQHKAAAELLVGGRGIAPSVQVTSPSWKRTTSVDSASSTCSALSSCSSPPSSTATSPSPMQTKDGFDGGSAGIHATSSSLCRTSYAMRMGRSTTSPWLASGTVLYAITWTVLSRS